MTVATDSFPQHILDEVFPRPPLREVSFEIRFATRLRVNAELWKIQEEIVDTYPVVGSEQLVQPSGITAVNVFQNPISGRVIKVSQENFVVAFTRYVRFEDFKEEVINRSSQFCSKFDVHAVNRLGLRYVNNILIPSSEKTSGLLKFVRPFVDFERVPVDHVEQFVSEVRMRERGHMVTLRGALLAPLDDGRRVYVLDIDCHSAGEHRATEVPALLDRYHETAQMFFLDHVTDEYKDVMRGKS
jgi:uncharacterized protein (TIGR04255 family)